MTNITAVYGNDKHLAFEKEFNGCNVLPNKALRFYCRLPYFENDTPNTIKISSSITTSHHLWSGNKSEQTEHIEQVEFLRTIKNKLAYLSKYSHLTATDVDDFELALMGHYLDRLLES